MSLIIEIRDSEKNVLNVQFKDILFLLEAYSALKWRLLDIEATGELTTGENMLDLEQRVMDSSTGVPIDWTFLRNLSKEVNFFVSLLVVGSENNILISEPFTDEKMLANYEVMIDCSDSSFWRIYTKNGELVEVFSKQYKDVKILEM